MQKRHGVVTSTGAHACGLTDSLAANDDKEVTNKFGKLGNRFETEARFHTHLSVWLP